ncbi:MAG: epoxyqueuosine reductase QueH [Deltaproteobacteria bacterium]
MMPIRPRPDGEELLVHICCGPDAAYGVFALAERHRVLGWFFNPNIQPAEEHARRLEAVRRLREALPFPLEIASGGEEEWEEAVRGLEEEPEKGRRCEACIRLRMQRAAAEAKRRGIPNVATVLTVSPKKDAATVNRIGREEAEAAGVFFLEADLKKRDGFKKSVEISKRLGLYRQNYCGCRFSLRRPGVTPRRLP